MGTVYAAVGERGEVADDVGAESPLLRLAPPDRAARRRVLLCSAGIRFWVLREGG